MTIGEIRTQKDPNLHRLSDDTAEWETVEIETLRSKFEEKWGEHCERRTIVEKPDGSKTIYETYYMDIPQSPHEGDQLILDFISTASILGYSSTIATIVIPANPRLFQYARSKSTVFFCLERDEP